MDAQRGFSAIEVLVGAAIAFVLGWQLLVLTHTVVLGAGHLDDRLRAQSAAGRLEERLSSDATTAWSVFVPPVDVNGTENADGHELDFVTEDASHRTFWWAYAYDAASKRVTCYAYLPGGGAHAGETYEGVARFVARVHPITDLAQPSSDAYDPLFAGVAVTAVEIPYGWNPAATGGNHLVRVTLEAGGVVRDALLASGTAPSHFTVVVDYTPAPTPAR